MLHVLDCRLFDQPKQQQPAAANSAHRTCSAADDLQLLNNIRDQQQQQMQMHYEQQQQQQQYLSQFNVQHSMAPSVAGLPGLQQQQQRPVTLAKAVAGVMANSKDWKERVEKMSVLAEVLTKQVRQLLCLGQQQGNWQQDSQPAGCINLLQQRG